MTAGTTYTDTGLHEGQSYVYTCEGVFGARNRFGIGSVTATPASVNPPTFSGLAAATGISSSSIRVSWLPAAGAGVAAALYKVYATRGGTIDWTATPSATAQAGTTSVTLTGLGDELGYTVGVRACSSAGNCDTNVITAAVTLADGGAPTTTGVSNAVTSNGAIVLSVPWVESQGALAKRKVYKRTGTTSAVITDFSLISTVTVSNVNSPNVDYD